MLGCFLEILISGDSWCQFSQVYDKEKYRRVKSDLEFLNLLKI